MRRKRTPHRFFGLAVVFLAVPFAIYLKHMDSFLHFFGVLICGFVAGMNTGMGINALRKKQ